VLKIVVEDSYSPLTSQTTLYFTIICNLHH